MLEVLHHLFGLVCGQNPDHTWAPGGVLLPFCQRCTGLYVGAFVATLLHFTLRPRPTSRWLWLNGGFLLLMIPFGFHWLPQGPVLRTVTGVLFGFGLVTFLALTLGKAGNRSPAANHDDIAFRRAEHCASYLGGLLATLALVPWLGANGDALAADTLALLATGGLLLLAGLVLVNLLFAMAGLFRRVHRTRPNPACQATEFQR